MNKNRYGYLAGKIPLFNTLADSHFVMAKEVEEAKHKLAETEKVLTKALEDKNADIARDISGQYHDQIHDLYKLGYNLLVFCLGEDGDGDAYIHLNMYKLDGNAPFPRQELNTFPISNVDWEILSNRVVFTEKVAQWDSSRRQLESEDPRHWPHYLVQRSSAATIHNVLELEGESWIPHIQGG